MKIKLNSGREIALARIEQWQSYAGVLAGLPNRAMNDRVIEGVRARALQHCLEGAAPYLVPPRLTPVETKPASAEYLRRTGMTAEQSAARDQQMHYEQLPAVVCVAVFNSDGLTKPDAEPMLSLTLIWFQDVCVTGGCGGTGAYPVARLGNAGDGVVLVRWGAAGE